MATAKNEKTVYETLSKVSVEKMVEKRSGLNYLSWSRAWDLLCEHYPNATYEIKKFTNEVTGETLPYLKDDELGYLVFTSITVDGLTHEMWLPAMNGANKALKPVRYTYMTKFNGEKTVEPATMFDINKTIMRCLAKNMAMFGLGINIYSGEDFPEAEPETEPEKAPEQQPAKPTAPEKRAAPADAQQPQKKEGAKSDTDAKPALSSQLFEKAKKQPKATIEKILESYSVNQSQRNILESLLKK